MCAINGFSWKDRPLIERMNTAVLHRGPDGSRVFEDRDLVTFGFNRLAIIDLSERGMQPMTDQSGRYTMAYNGEIYNFKELKKELQGYPFKSESDSEVVLAAYGKWGREAFAKLNGMFAIALWDRVDETLTLARDRAGIKPLYYSITGSGILFSSEIKALLEGPVPRTLDQESLVHYLRLMYVPAPRTMFKKVRKLEPGHMLRFQHGKVTLTSFLSETVSDKQRVDTYRESVSKVKQAVMGAVERQLVSDRPVGIYLSGGIDSSIVLSAASKSHPSINTYSIGFQLEEGEESEKFNRDQKLAEATAAHFGSKHHTFMLSADEVFKHFSRVVRHLDEPIANATALAQMYLAKEVKPTATVVLTGDGGDEVFGGYDRYRLAHRAKLLASLLPPVPGVSWSEKLHLTGEGRYGQLMFQKDVVARILSKKKPLPDTHALFTHYFTNVSSDIVSSLMKADRENWLVEEALMRTDKMAMAAGVEARVPFLDNEVVSLAQSLPRSYMVTPWLTKKILKDAFRSELPEVLFREPKRGWFSPGAKWLRRDAFVRFAEEAYTEGYAGEVARLFDMEELRTLWHLHREKKEYHYTILFAALVFFEWAHEYKVTL